MIETIFLRNNNDQYDEPCDVAGVPVQKISKNPSAPSSTVYIGMRAGVHEPTDCITYAHVETAGAWIWAAGQGYESMPDLDAKMPPERSNG
tara:strand:+ start:1489 stop:1761 length:273 start_codon:yes stop_codon:yes gene_type:complete